MNGGQFSSARGLSFFDAAVLRGTLGDYLLRGGYVATLDVPASDGMMLICAQEI